MILKLVIFTYTKVGQSCKYSPQILPKLVHQTFSHLLSEVKTLAQYVRMAKTAKNKPLPTIQRFGFCECGTTDNTVNASR